MILSHSRMVLNGLSYTFRKVEGGVSETSAAIVHGRGVGETFLPRGIAKNTDTHSTTLVNPINIFGPKDHMNLKRYSNRSLLYPHLSLSLNVTV